MRESTRFEILFAAAWAGLAAILILLGADAGVVCALVLVPILARHIFHLLRLGRWIHRHHRLVPPFPRGIWGDVYRSIAQYQQRARKRRRRQLRFTRRFREAAMSVPDALVVLSRQKRVEWANPAASGLLDLSWPRDDGRRLEDILHHPQLKEFIRSGDYGRPLELAPEHNRAIMLSLRITPLGARKRQRLIVARDITKIFHLNMIRRDFVANASHELRTPLTVVAGFLETLSDSTDTPESHRRPLQLMVNQTERMRSIIDDLLTLSRLEMADRSTELAPSDLPEEIRGIVNDARALCAGSHAIVLDMDPNLRVLGNAPELRSAFSNLVFNAVKHTPPGTRVRVTWIKEGGHPTFTVTDNGGGIAPEHIPRLTERFYRIDKARSRTHGGTGLGLAIVKHVLNRHDARLIIASEVGKGSSFICRFPQSSALAAETSAVSPPASQG